MPKLNYFDTLESLAVSASRAVFLACGRSAAVGRSELCKLCGDACERVCELERALFSDFMPPLDRGGIARCAHSLLRLTVLCQATLEDRCANRSPPSLSPTECNDTVELARLLETTVSRLRRIKRPGEMPELDRFRRLLCRCTEPSDRRLRKLRRELSLCFDTVVGIMLDNI